MFLLRQAARFTSIAAEEVAKGGATARSSMHLCRRSVLQEGKKGNLLSICLIQHKGNCVGKTKRKERGRGFQFSFFLSCTKNLVKKQKISLQYAKNHGTIY